MQILVIDDEKRVVTEICEFLTRQGHHAEGLLNPLQGIEKLKTTAYDILILDVMLPEIGGIEVLNMIKPEYPDMDVIVISGHGDMDTVIAAMRAGAADYLKKPFRHHELLIAMERTHRLHQMKTEIKRLSDDNNLISKELYKRIDHQLIGNSPQIRTVLDLAMKAAGYADLPVLITGESGTGKEIISRLIHHAGARKDNNFLAINCSAIPDNMLESEFFGYRRGAFTGALTDRKGYFEYCNRGTLFLDEIADMPMFLQSKLLRVLEDKSVTKLGMDKPVPVNVRFISATNRDLTKDIADGRFRLDLFHRINTFHIPIPPLRERISEVPIIAEHYLKTLCNQYNKPLSTLHPEAMEILMQYSYPGNVRELKNLLERAILITMDRVLTPDFFPLMNNRELTVSFSKTPIQNYNLEQNENDLVKKALHAVDNNQTKAAELLGISRHALIRKLRQKTKL